MNTKLTLLAGITALTVLFLIPETTEAQSFGHGKRSFGHGKRSFSHGRRSFSRSRRSFGHGKRSFGHGKKFFSGHKGRSFSRGKRFFKHSGTRFISSRSSYCSPSYRRSVTYYSPSTKYIQEAEKHISVADVQYVLKERGYDIGEVDGVIGEKTTSAIALFQKNIGVESTGELTQPTLRALGF